MVGFRGQFGVWTDNETSFVDSAAPSVPLEIRTPGVWTGTDYYDPAYARALSRQTYLATQNLLGDAALANLYAADPNPLGHSAGNVLAGVTGGYFGGPAGSAVAVTAWETLYSTALGEPIQDALAQGVIAGVTDFAAGKVFHFAAAGIGAGAKKIAGKFIGNIGSEAVASPGAVYALGHTYDLPASLLGKARVYGFVAYERTRFAISKRSLGGIVNGGVNDTAQRVIRGSYEPVENVITLYQGHNIGTLAEELFHFQQARKLGVIGKGFPAQYLGSSYYESQVEQRAHRFLTGTLGFTINRTRLY